MQNEYLSLNKPLASQLLLVLFLTGTLLSETVMLTAAHCVAGNDVTYVRFDEEGLDGIGDYGSLQDWFDAEWIEAAAVVPHPDYDDYSEFPEIYDIGLIFLSEPYPLAEYGALPTLDFLQEVKDLPGNKDNWWTAVGYGMQGVINPFYGDDYARRQANTRLINLNSFHTGNGQVAKFTNNPGKGRGGKGSGGTCYG